jgi:hypothetical protein
VSDEEPEFEHITTEAAVASYEASAPIFRGLLEEVRFLSKKKPEATMSAGKVRIVNRVLEDLLAFLKNEPTGKYLELLDDKTLPQMSDAVLTMVQFETALKAFRARYYVDVNGTDYWITSELLENWKESEEDEDEIEGEEQEEEDDLREDDDGEANEDDVDDDEDEVEENKRR